MGFLEEWDLTHDEMNELLAQNPSLRSFVSGYAAELKCKNLFFVNDPRASDVIKYDDHDRTHKGDIHLTYRGRVFSIEVKSLQMNSIREGNKLEATKLEIPAGTLKRGVFQCDASDRRRVVFKDGTSVETTCLLVGEFDVVAVNLHGFYGRWEFVFARNSELPTVSGIRGKARDYTELQRSSLLASSIPVFYPNAGTIFHKEPWGIFDSILEDDAKNYIPEPPIIIDG